jgi:hypothetical protein
VKEDEDECKKEREETRKTSQTRGQGAMPTTVRIPSISLGVRRRAMRRTRFFTTVLECVVLTTFLHANCNSDQDI